MERKQGWEPFSAQSGPGDGGRWYLEVAVGVAGMVEEAGDPVHRLACRRRGGGTRRGV